MKPVDLLNVLVKNRNVLFMNKINLLTVVGTLCIAPLALAEAVDLTKLPPASSKPNVTFAGDIKPIFEKSCIKCHSEQKPKGKLRLDTLENVMKGGGDGKVVRPGSSDKSVLIVDVARIGDEEDWMPPKNNKAHIPALTKDEVGLIRAWIDQGAK
jgi:hypothetical protein